MALFSHDRQTECNDAGREAYLHTCTRAERPCVNGWRLRRTTCTFYFSGNFESAREYAGRGVRIWHSGAVQSPIEEVDPPAVACLFYESLCEWHFGEIASSQATMAEAIALAKGLNDMHGLAEALAFGAYLAVYERKPAEVERLASDLIELSMSHNFAAWLAGGAIFRGWARSAYGDTAEGVARIEHGIRDWRATGSMIGVPVWLGLKAEALHLAGRTSEALDAIREAEATAERSEERCWCAELHGLRAVFLAPVGADEAQIEVPFREAIRIARAQKSLSLQRRAEASYAEYCHQKHRA
jgi:predicted ATPase